ncbi:MAG TPA: histidine phosphatase family protein [Candidatus Saccharimonadales bacterium]|nr:histidine phosphatase family protein [Candidatus Saccharimonadales bacterium]
MNQFYIVRHGETENNRAKRLSGWIDTPLTPEGLIPTQRVIEKLKGTEFDAVYSSDLGRAFVTAYVVLRGIGCNKEIIRAPGLREVNYGVAANLPSVRAYELYPQLDRESHYKPSEGESLDEMQRRVFATIKEVDDTHTNATILIVAHSGVMAALRASHIGQDFGEHNISEAYDHDYVGRFTFKNGIVTSFEAFRPEH